MFDEFALALEKRVNDLIKCGRDKEAEALLLAAYSERKEAGVGKQLEYVTYRLAHFYSMPQSEDLAKAERYFLQRETQSPTVYELLQTATFYFYICGDFAKTINKVEAIKALGDVTEDPSYYSALALKGHALLELNRVSEAGQVLEELLCMAKNTSRLPYGDEFNFLQAAISAKILAPKCREILRLIIPRIRSQEYMEKAKVLLESSE